MEGNDDTSLTKNRFFQIYWSARGEGGGGRGEGGGGRGGEGGGGRGEGGGGEGGLWFSPRFTAPCHVRNVTSEQKSA